MSQKEPNHITRAWCDQEELNHRSGREGNVSISVGVGLTTAVTHQKPREGAAAQECP